MRPKGYFKPLLFIMTQLALRRVRQIGWETFWLMLINNWPKAVFGQQTLIKRWNTLNLFVYIKKFFYLYWMLNARRDDKKRPYIFTWQSSLPQVAWKVAVFNRKMSNRAVDVCYVYVFVCIYRQREWRVKLHSVGSDLIWQSFEVDKISRFLILLLLVMKYTHFPCCNPLSWKKRWMSLGVSKRRMIKNGPTCNDAF